MKDTLGDKSLRAIREHLVARATELRERIGRVGQDLGRRNAPLPGDAPDAAIILENDEILQAIDETARRELQQIEHALERLEAGTIENCETCGAPIEPERRRAVPYTTRCRHCAQEA